MDYNKAINLLRSKFIEEDSDLISKLGGYKKTGVFSSNKLKDFFYKNLLETFELSNFYSMRLLQFYEELIYVYRLNEYENPDFCLRGYINEDALNKEKLIKDAEDSHTIIKAMDFIKNDIKETADEIFGISDLDVKNLDQDFVCVKNYMRAIEKGKKISLSYYGEEDFLVSKIYLNGKGFILPKNFSLNNNIFYSSSSEYIIQMANVAQPGIYLIANIPQDQIYKSGFYVLFVTEGDAYVVDNNIHALRSFITRNPQKYTERKMEKVFLPWEVLSDFIENKNSRKDLISYNREFPFKSIGKICDTNNVDIIGTFAFIDSCLYIFSKTNFLEKVSPAATANMILPEIEKKEKSLAVYQKGLPSLNDLDLRWDAEKLGINPLNSGSYLEPLIKEIKKIDLPQKDELKPLSQIERSLMYEKRRKEAKNLEKRLKKDHEKNWGSVRSWLKEYIHHKFEEKPDYWIERALQDREYPIRVYRQFSGFETFENKEFEDKKEKILSDRNETIFYGELNFSFQRHEDPPLCFYCGKNGKELIKLRIRDVSQFVEFFELSKEEKKRLPKQMRLYLNQARTMYSGNSILQDLDPLSLIHNPWWVRPHGGCSPEITVSFVLCRTHKKSILKRLNKNEKN